MVSLKILAPFTGRYELHPFYRWKKQLAEHGIDVKIYFDHKNNSLQEADVLLMHHKYFDFVGWQKTSKNPDLDESRLYEYLIEMKKHTGKLVWLDTQDSTGGGHFSIIKHVDVYAKKQVLKDLDYYIKPDSKLRIWLNPEVQQQKLVPCPQDQLHKIKAAWNVGTKDYRQYKYKLYALSNYLSYKLHPIRYTDIDANRAYDLTFRGSVKGYSDGVSWQRDTLIKMFDSLKLNIAHGGIVNKTQYWKELRNSKVSVSPFGYGEICYRDFETFVSGSLLIKPSMEHLITFPNVFIPNETYIPVSWDLSDLPEKLEQIIDNFNEYKHIAKNGQEIYRNINDNPEPFIERVKYIIG